MSDTLYIYVFVRRDISLPQQIVQVGHVCGVSGEKFGEKGSNIVLLGIENQEALLELSFLFDHNAIEHVKFLEPDDDMGYSSLATSPLTSEKRKRVQRLINKLRLDLWY